MSNILEVHSAVVSYADENVSNNPRLRTVDWSKNQSAITVGRPLIVEHRIAPRATEVLFSGTRLLSIDNTTELGLSLISAATSTYRIYHMGGALPVFREDRELILSGEEITVTINNNATAKFALNPLSLLSFAAVEVGDTLFIPGLLTNDSASVFSESNVGFWLVLARQDANKSLVVRRLIGEDFNGVAEVVTLTDSAQLQAFTSSGVQVGDSFEIAAGFSSVSHSTYKVASVTHDRIDFVSAEPLPEETGVVITISGLVVYSNSKTFIRIESDQKTSVRFNADTSDNTKISPIETSSINDMGWIEKYGPTYALSVKNLSDSPARVILISVG